MNNPPAIVREEASIADLSREIKLAYEEFARSKRFTLSLAVKLGKKLNIVRGRVEHGEWLPFLQNAGIPQRMASVYMRVAKLPQPAEFDSIREALDAFKSNPEPKTAEPENMREAAKSQAKDFVDRNKRSQSKPIPPIKRMRVSEEEVIAEMIAGGRQRCDQQLRQIEDALSTMPDGTDLIERRNRYASIRDEIPEIAKRLHLK